MNRRLLLTLLSQNLLWIELSAHVGNNLIICWFHLIHLCNNVRHLRWVCSIILIQLILISINILQSHYNIIELLPNLSNFWSVEILVAYNWIWICNVVWWLFWSFTWTWYIYRRLSVVILHGWKLMYVLIVIENLSYLLTWWWSVSILYLCLRYLDESIHFRYFVWWAWIFLNFIQVYHRIGVFWWCITSWTLSSSSHFSTYCRYFSGILLLLSIQIVFLILSNHLIKEPVFFLGHSQNTLLWWILIMLGTCALFRSILDRYRWLKRIWH